MALGAWARCSRPATSGSRFVALKILHAPTTADTALRERFQREARPVAALSHPNIVTIFSTEEHAGAPFLTMELLEGQTLGELLLADRPRQILGTVAYMSPEQAEGKAIDYCSDIFSLGIILYELATGTKPFTGESNVAVLSSILRDTPPLVSDVAPAMPVAIARLIRRCLEKNNASQRLQSCLDLKHELEDVRSEMSASRTASRVAPSVVPRSPTARSRGAPAALVLALVLAGSGYLVWTRWPTATTGSTDAARSDAAPITVRRFENRTLLRDAFARGLSMSLGLHRQMDLETLRGFAPYDELMKIQGLIIRDDQSIR